MTERSTLFRQLLVGRHWQKFETFRAEFLKAAAQIDPELAGAAPSKAQYYRWLTGQLTTGRPYPDACRVLEAMFPNYTAEDLFRQPHPRLLDGNLSINHNDSPTNTQSNSIAGRESLLAGTPPSFPAKSLAGLWVTSYQFGPRGP